MYNAYLIVVKIEGKRLGNLSKILVLVIICASLLSCTCATPLKVSEIQKSDKKLSCKDVILEINESEHYRALAKKEEGIHFGNMLMPVCWVTGYVDSRKAISAAEARVKYLGHIYDVLDCGGKSDKSEKPAAAGAAPFVAPPIIQIQPVQDIPAAVETQKAPSSSKAGQCTTQENIAKYTHQHTDRLGRVYTHCHYNTGPHKHLDD